MHILSKYALSSQKQVKLILPKTSPNQHKMRMVEIPSSNLLVAELVNPNAKGVKCKRILSNTEKMVKCRQY